jgi:hypothetical protein
MDSGMITSAERDAYRLLYAGFVAAPLVAGFDKFTDKLGNWIGIYPTRLPRSCPFNGTPSCRLSG